MAERIVDVISISSASGWFLGGGEKDEPLTVWALVSVIDDAFPTLGASKQIVGVTSSELDSLFSLDLSGRLYWHQSEID